MPRCFLTGVEFRVEDGHLVNRSDAWRLLRTLRRRAESLERVLAQLSPLDEPAAQGAAGARAPGGRVHRMVCKAVAEVLARAHPEIELFLAWPALRARNLRHRLGLLREHPLYGVSLRGLSDEELAQVAQLGRKVLRQIDPRRTLSRRTVLAVTAGICARHRLEPAGRIAALIRSAISRGGSLADMGVPAEESSLVAASLTHLIPKGAPGPSEHAVE